MKKFRIILPIMLVFIFSCVCENYNVKDTNSTLDNKNVVISSNNPVCNQNSCGNCVNGLAGKFCKPLRQYIYVVGKGAPPNDENLSEVQRYLLAERAAIVDGYRQLAEKLQGFIVTTLTKAGNYVINMDMVKVQAESLIRGAEVVEINHNDNGVCTAKIKILLPRESKIISAYNEYSGNF